MGLKAGWLALFVFVWMIGAWLGSTFEYQSAEGEQGVSETGLATFTNGSAIVIGAGTTWNNTYVNGNMRADADNIWHKILSVNSTTNLTLYTPYSGTGGAGIAYTMAVSPGFVGTGTAGYGESPVTTLQYLMNISNAIQRLPVFGNIPLPIPNGEYFKAAYKVVTWQWSFLDGYEMFYWLFCAPFVMMGVLSLILLVYGVLTGNITL